MKRKARTKAYSTNILDYHSNLSMIDKEELVAKAKLAAGGKVIAKPQGTASTKLRSRSVSTCD
jgi:hypothetical protein